MKIIQDIVKTKHNDINHTPDERVLHTPPSARPPHRPIDEGILEPRGSKKGIWLVAVLSAVVLFFAISVLFAGATVKVTPRAHQSDLDNDIIAKKEAGEGELPFEVMSLKGEEVKTLEGGSPKAVSQKAVGTVILYNKFSDKPQKLLINTRLESKDGKIYKTDTAVVLPGYRMKGTEIIPGALEVAVTADTPGAEGNSDMTDFTIPGFKGSAKYDKFFGRSKTPITGGVVGTVYQADPEVLQKAKDDSLAALHTKLLKQAAAQIPKGYILYENASYFISDGEPANTTSPTSQIQLTQKGTLYAFIFDREKLSQRIARETVSQFDGAPIEIPDLESLEFIIKNTDHPDLANAGQITFHLRGTVRTIWKFESKDLIRDLISKKKKDIDTVLSSYKNIDRAEVVISPFWKSSFPDDPTKFKVVNMLGN